MPYIWQAIIFSFKIHPMLKLSKNKDVYWIAILAILFITLAPLITQASPLSNELEQYDVICSSSGIKIVNGNDSNGSDDIHPMVHCSYCSLLSDKIIPYRYNFISIKNNHILAKPSSNYNPQSIYKYFLFTLLPNAPPKA